MPVGRQVHFDIPQAFILDEFGDDGCDAAVGMFMTNEDLGVSHTITSGWFRTEAVPGGTSVSYSTRENLQHYESIANSGGVRSGPAMAEKKPLFVSAT
jgi:hypothetical protein